MVGSWNLGAMGVWEDSVVVASNIVDIVAFSRLRVLTCKSHVFPSLCMPRNNRRQWHIVQHSVNRGSNRIL